LLCCHHFIFHYVGYLDAVTSRLTVTGQRVEFFPSLFNSVQIQLANVRTRSGYAKKGSGEAVGKTCSPQKILAAVIAKRIAPRVPASRIHMANSLGTLVRRSAADYNAVPAANAGTLASSVPAVPDSMTASPMANTRKPAETVSFPARKYFNVSSAVATISPTVKPPGSGPQICLRDDGT